MAGAELQDRLRGAFRWSPGADVSGWWRDPTLLGDTVEALADLHASSEPTVAIGVVSRGALLGPLVAQQLGIGFVEARKDLKGDVDGENLLQRRTPPDYVQRSLRLTLRRGLLGPRDRVLLVDDWIETGAQARAVRHLVDDAETGWVGAAVIVDATTAAIRRELGVKSLLSVRQLD